MRRPQSLDLKLLRLHLAMPRKRLLRIRAELLHPLAQHVLMDGQIACRLPTGNAALPHQLDSLNLELPRKPSPASCSIKHLKSVSSEPGAGQNPLPNVG